MQDSARHFTARLALAFCALLSCCQQVPDGSQVADVDIAAENAKLDFECTSDPAKQVSQLEKIRKVILHICQNAGPELEQKCPDGCLMGENPFDSTTTSGLILRAEPRISGNKLSGLVLGIRYNFISAKKSEEIITCSNPITHPVFLSEVKNLYSKECKGINNSVNNKAEPAGTIPKPGTGNTSSAGLLGTHAVSTMVTKGMCGEKYKQQMNTLFTTWLNQSNCSKTLSGASCAQGSCWDYYSYDALKGDTSNLFQISVDADVNALTGEFRATLNVNFDPNTALKPGPMCVAYPFLGVYKAFQDHLQSQWPYLAAANGCKAEAFPN